MRVFHRVDERLFLIGAAVLADGGGFEEFFVMGVATFEALRRGAGWWADGVDRLLWEGKIEWPIFASQEAGGGEGFELFAFADVEALADVDEGGDGRIERAERAGDDPASGPGGHRLRRGPTGMP